MSTAYDHPNCIVTRQTYLHAAQGAASLVTFADFIVRGKIRVRSVTAYLVSAASAAGGTLHVTRSGVTIASQTMVSATSVGSVYTFTLDSLNTLSTVTEIMGLRVSGAADKGKYNVIYEYEVLPDSPDPIGGT